MATFLESTRNRASEAASALGLEASVFGILEKPKQVLAFDIPLPMSDGSAKVFKAWRVQHSDARGPYKGGVRYHPDANLEEISALAALMTWKTALCGLPYGGAKGAVTVDPKALSPKELEALSRSYVRKIVDSLGPAKDIPAPDIGTNQQIMAWMADEYAKLVGHFEPAAFTGKPVAIGGSHGRDIATGFGGAAVLREYLRINPPAGRAGKQGLGSKNLRVVIQGTGNVGGVIAGELAKAGHRIIAISDSQGGITSEKGVDVRAVLAEKEKTGKPIIEIEKSAKHISNEELLEFDADVLIPAALENVITAENAPRVQARLVLEMANGPVAPEAEAMLAARGIEVIPDILANAGGVAGSYFEWVQGLARLSWEEDDVLARIEKMMTRAFAAVHAEQAKGGTLREAAYRIAVGRVAEAMRMRGWV